MGKVGSVFRDARLGKGLTLDQVSDETNISKRFLQGIESDNFEGFPGEVYILGFLRNYAEFLGLDAMQIVTRYRQSEAPQGSEEQSEGLAFSPEVKTSNISESTPITESQASVPSPSTGESDKDHPAQAQDMPRGPSSKEEETDQTPSLFSEAEGEENRTSSSSAKRKNTGKKRHNARPDIQEKRVGGDEASHYAVEFKEGSPPSGQASQTPEAQHLSRSETEKPLKSKSIHIQAGRMLPFVLVGIVLIIAAISIVPKLKLPVGTSHPSAEYRAEGLPFEQRLYPQDKVYLPLGDDFISITLKSIRDKVAFDTPYGTLTAGLNEETVINPSADNERLIATVKDYAPNESQNGALVHFDVKEALSQSESSGDISVPVEPGTAAAPQGAQATPAGQASQEQAAPVVLFRSSGGPHPFYVNISFMSPVLFRYEADRKEWVEKYYRKGESVTVNASNGITFWTANAQAVKVSVFQSAGKSTELVMGGPGEIAVQRLTWSNTQGGWAMVAMPLD